MPYDARVFRVSQTDPPLTICAVPGSLRRTSYNHGLLHAARELAPDRVEIRIGTLEAVPFFNEDVEAEGIPPGVTGLVDAVQGADGLLIATPEYNHGISGVLKNAVDWLSRPSVGAPLRGKVVGVIGASPGTVGTARAQLQARSLFTTLGAVVVPPPEVLVAHAHERFDAQCRLTDEATRKALSAFLGRLVGLIRRR